MRFLIILPAIFGIALCGNQSSGEKKAFTFPNGAHGAVVNQQHGYNGNPIVNMANGGNSQGNDAAGAGAQTAGVGAQNAGGEAQQTGGGQGGNSQGNDAAGGAAPLGGGTGVRIIPGGDSQDQDYQAMYGAIPPQSGRQQNAGNTNYGRIPAQGNGAGAGANSNDVDQGVGGNAWAGTGGNNAVNPGPNAAPVAGGAELGVMAHHDSYEEAGMSGAAVAGVVAAVVAVGAVGTGVAVYVLKSGASSASPV